MAISNAPSFSETLNNIKTKFGNDDLDWVKFVHDHYQLIFDHATIKYLDASEHYWEYFRVEDYLKDLGMDPNVSWIVLLINQMDSRAKFKEIKSLLIPDMTHLEALWRSFMQYRTHIKNCRG